MGPWTRAEKIALAALVVAVLDTLPKWPPIVGHLLPTSSKDVQIPSSLPVTKNDHVPTASAPQLVADRTTHREATTRVSAQDPDWQDTGIDVSAGARMTFSAGGDVVHWRSRDGAQAKSCGPDGVPGPTQEDVYLAPGLAKMALVGKVRNQFFNVGSGTTILTPAEGRLYLGINDTNKFGGCADNEGFWAVRISY